MVIPHIPKPGCRGSQQGHPLLDALGVSCARPAPQRPQSWPWAGLGDTALSRSQRWVCGSPRESRSGSSACNEA